MISAPPTKKTVKAMDDLLRQKRSQTPSPSAMASFDRTFAPRLMAEVARPHHSSTRALRLVGWVSPLVFGAVAVLAFGVAYFASPIRATARWEAATSGREYVVDTLHNDQTATPWMVEQSIRRIADAAANTSATADISTIATRSLNHF